MNAGGQVRHGHLTQARVGARRAGLRALDARFDAGHQLCFVDLAEILGIGVEHGCSRAHGSSLSVEKHAYGCCLQTTTQGEPIPVKSYG